MGSCSTTTDKETTEKKCQVIQAGDILALHHPQEAIPVQLHLPVAIQVRLHVRLEDTQAQHHHKEDIQAQHLHKEDIQAMVHHNNLLWIPRFSNGSMQSILIDPVKLMQKNFKKLW